MGATAFERIPQSFRQFAGKVMQQREIDTQLDLLRDRVLLLGGKTEEAVHRAMRSLTERDSELARSVCEADEQIDQMMHLASVTTAPTERMALLQGALALVTEAAPRLSAEEAEKYRSDVEGAIREEVAIDKRYSDLSRKFLDQADRAAQRADSSSIERIVTKVREEDAKLGQKRPHTVEALNASLHGKLADSRRLRLLRDQWTLRRDSYRQYQSSVGSSLLLLVKSTASLRAIRTLDGPNPEQLVVLKSQLSGGADRLERMRTPEYLRDVHERLVGAWRFAENAVRARFGAESGLRGAASLGR